MPDDAPDAPGWHGWGIGDTTLSIAPSPDNGRVIALILTVDGAHEVVGEFLSEYHAKDTMAFLDGAFRFAAEANAAMVERGA